MEMPQPTLLGYTPETVIAEKFESIVKRGIINTRMKDFYDLWTILNQGNLDRDQLTVAIRKVFANRGTKIEFPVAFTSAFYEDPETAKRWQNFLDGMGKSPIKLEGVISEISNHIKPLIS